MCADQIQENSQKQDDTQFRNLARNLRPFYDRVVHNLTVYDGSEKCVFEGTVVGYKKIALLDQIQTKELVKSYKRTSN